MRHLKNFESLSFNTPQKNHYFGESDKSNHYMFHQNLRNMKRAIEDMLEMGQDKIDPILADGHDWAEDHISVAMENIEQVYGFIVGREHESPENGGNQEEEEEGITIKGDDDDVEVENEED